jgi:hypothetical protein
MEESMKAYPAALVACSLLLLSHVSPAQGVVGGTIVATVGGSFQLTPITGEPYSATTETEVHQTLADGTHIDRKSQIIKQYRDSQGRTREEHYMGPLNSYIGGIPDGQAPTLVNVMIQDPVAGTAWFLSPQNHSARLTNMNSNLHNTPPQPVNTAPPPPMPRASLPKVTHEDLGTQTMEGLIVEGTRSTITIPTGAQGNDRPIETVTDTWRSNELHLVVLTTRSDPRNGEMTTRVTNIDRSEPDLSLFQVPADYTVTQPQ